MSLFPNPSNLEFKLKVIEAANQIIQLYITDMFGNKVYQASGDRNKTFLFGRTFAPGTYFVRVIQGSDTKTMKIIKTGR